MLQLDCQAIHLDSQATDKFQVIKMVAGALTEAGSVSSAYVEGMLIREQQTSTYLGNGIAIPHGTTDTRDLVLKTDVQVFQFPKGIEWQDGQIAYLVIGIAAKSDEHLGLLKQLTQVLSDETLAQQLRTASAEQIRAILMGETRDEAFYFNSSLITLDVTASDLVTLQAINSGKLQSIGAVTKTFMADVISRTPLYLGQGVWLADSHEGNLFGAIAVARPKPIFITAEQQQVALLITVAGNDQQCLQVIRPLQQLLANQQAKVLQDCDATTLENYLRGMIPEDNDSEVAEFTIRNAHGLHARPGTALVTVIKQFDCDVSIVNLDGSGKPANGRSLMKVVALGVKQGNRLRFTASGPQANEAIAAIGSAIESGLGEAV